MRRLDLTGSRLSDVGFASVRSELKRCEVIGQPQVQVFYDDGHDGALFRHSVNPRPPIAISDR